MTTQATLPATTATRHEASSTAWLWWKETRQLAPLLVLLIMVALMIVLLKAVMTMATRSFPLLSHEVTMLFFPGLFATGAGPLLVGQERTQRTLDWLVLLPISARRVAVTKLCVGLAGLVVMWVFTLLFTAVLHLNGLISSQRMIGQLAHSTNPPSYLVWVAHSLFILLAGFYVAWRIKKQFYSLIALIPLAFAPLIATAMVEVFSSQRFMSSKGDWINFAFTLLGIIAITPLMSRAAKRTLSPAVAPRREPLRDVLTHFLAHETKPSVPPRCSTQIAPIIWQTIHAAKGLWAILVGMLMLSFLGVCLMSTVGHQHEMAQFLSLSLVLAPLAVCWLGISVFKHDGASERIRFLADRGVSHHQTYFALHAVPTAILCTSLLIYGLWNLTISNRPSSPQLPTLVTLMLFSLLIYGISQWVSQLVRTLILAVILAPLLSLIVIAWLISSLASTGLPMIALVPCALAPLVATFVMMRRYMDTQDRPRTFIVSGTVIAVIIFVPIGFAVARVRSIPAMTSQVRAELSAEARQIRNQAPPTVSITIPFFNHAEEAYQFDRNKLDELKGDLERSSLDPQRLVQPLVNGSENLGIAATSDIWNHSQWYGSFADARFQWRQSGDDEAWSPLANWLDASATLLPALRHSTWLHDQELADRLEVMMLDTLQTDIPAERLEENAVQAAAESLGTPASRAAARRRAVLATWQSRKNRLAFEAMHICDQQPPSLAAWTVPRLEEFMVGALLEGIEASRSRAASKAWRIKLHSIHQTGETFESSRYGDRMRSIPAIETMNVGQGFNGYGQLWGRDWEYIDLKTTVATP